MNHMPATLAILVTVCLAEPGSAGNFDLSWHTIDSGGAMFSNGGEYELSGTIGQPDAGYASGGDFELIGGFWAGARPTVAGDCNLDGSIDLSDFTCFSDCLAGPGAAPAPQCFGFDFDADNDVDILDYGNFQTNFDE